jgi:hypothetical protein
MKQTVFGCVMIVWATAASAQVVTFSQVQDATPGYGYEAALSSATGNTLTIGLSDFAARSRAVPLTTNYVRQTASDTVTLVIEAPAGYTIAAITYRQSGSGSNVRVAKASGVTSWTVAGYPYSATYGTNPNVARRVDLAGYGLTSAAVTVTTDLFAWAPATSGDASIRLSAARIEVELARD